MKYELKGAKELQKQLQSIEAKLAKKILRKAVREACKTVAIEMRAEAPVDTGVLKRSIKVRMNKMKKKIISCSAFVTGGRTNAFVGSIEFGNKKMDAQPFVGSSFDKKLDEISETLRNSIDQGIQDIVKEG